MAILSHNGFTIHYELTSDGENDARPVIVFSHPLGSNLEVWKPQCDELKKQFQILRYDHPGHGESSTWAGSSGRIEDLGEIVIALLDELGLEKAAFCGLSLGGMVGQWLGAHRAKRISRLILANTCSRIENPALLRARIKSLRFPEIEDLSAIAENVLDGWFTEAFQTDNPDLIDAERERLLGTSPGEYAAMAEFICDLNLESTAANIQVPTLVVAGTHDLATPPAWGHALADRIRDSRYEELPAAHLCNVGATGLFNRLLVDYNRMS